jgi:hypothetical protein
MIEGYPTIESTLGEFCDFYGYRVEHHKKYRCNLVDVLDGENVLVNVPRSTIHTWIKHRYATVKPHRDIVK